MEYIVKISGGEVWLPAGAERLNGNYVIAQLEPEEAEALMGRREVEYLEPAEGVYPAQLRRSAAGAPVGAAAAAPRSLTGNGVVIGVIDSGIDASHPLFRAGSILSIWDLTQDGDPPVGFHKGRVLHGQEVLQCQDSVGHGTAVAGVAVQTASGASLIGVKLSDREARTTDIMRGVCYIIRRARELGMPCVVNLSYGTNLGSHRGESLFEAYLDEISGAWKTLIVCASGNEGGAAHHAHLSLEDGRAEQAGFSIGAALSSLYVDSWSSFADDLAWTLSAPNGRQIGPHPLGGRDGRYDLAGAEVAAVHRGPTHYSAAQEVVFRLRAAQLPLGSWTLTFLGERVVDGTVDLWLPTTEEVGERTAFLTPCPELTAAIPATARRTVAVAGYHKETGTLSVFSGRGSQGYTDRVPDLAAPAEGVRSARAGGGYDRFSGTSMAAPAVSGAAALAMEWGVVQRNDPFLYGQRLRAFLGRYADRQRGISYPNPLWGYGSLDIPALLAGLREHRWEGGRL